LRNFNRPDKPESLVEEAQIASLDLAFNLYNSGQTSFGRVLTDKLNDQSRVIRYYAAFKLSYLNDKKLATKAVPVLKKLMAEEKDQELVDRAKIALLRISPESFKDLKNHAESGDYRLIKIRIYEKGKKAASVSVNFPLALADLALQAMSEEDKNRIKQKGYDLDRLLDDLAKSREKLVRIEDEGNLIEIWIE
jgi:predicted HTH domain antitoxin